MGIVSMSKLQLIPRYRPTSRKYQEHIDAALKLKVGEAWCVRIPSGVTPKQFHARLQIVLNRARGHGPKGHRYSLQTTADLKHVAVVLLPNRT